MPYWPPFATQLCTGTRSKFIMKKYEIISIAES